MRASFGGRWCDERVGMNVFAPRLFWVSICFLATVDAACENCLPGSCANSICTACYPGYFELFGICYACGENCATCNFFNPCLTCLDFASLVHYKPPGATSCFRCKNCAVGQAMTVECTSIADTTCTTCADDSVVANLANGLQQCRQCTVGTYRSADKLRCAPCKSCTSEQYVKPGDECTLARDRVCTDCPNNRATTIVNSGSCDTCRPGYYLQGGVCFLCSSAPCPVDRYQDCSNAVRTCNLCAGMVESNRCEVGFGPNPSLCPAGATANSVCEPCPAGSERPSLAPLKCSKCNDGFYKTQAGVGVCTRCTNAPADNSFYLPWGNTLATTASCEW
jgi:hypothetical protein